MILFAMRVVRVRSPLSNRTSLVLKDECYIEKLGMNDRSNVFLGQRMGMNKSMNKLETLVLYFPRDTELNICTINLSTNQMELIP